MIRDIESDRFAQARRLMVENQLRDRNIADLRVLRIMGDIPRERFVPPDKQGDAYEDRALAIGMNQTISQPYMVALMTEKLCVTSESRVLEVGTGSGYQTAVLARLAKEVYTVERIAELSGRAKDILIEIGIDNVHYRVDDGTMGWCEQAPFDRILVTAGAPDVPKSLTDQLAEGGLLVIPVGPSDSQTLTRVYRIDGRLRHEAIISCRFVKLIGQEGWPKDTEES